MKYIRKSILRLLHNYYLISCSPSKRLAGKSISKMTYFMSSGTLNFNSVGHSCLLHIWYAVYHC